MPGIAQAVLHGKLDLDDVLVFGQHGRLAQPGGLDDCVAPHVDRADLGHKNQLMTLDRIGQPPVETGADVIWYLPNWVMTAC
jgi:hypothetical protein